MPNIPKTRRNLPNRLINSIWFWIAAVLFFVIISLIVDNKYNDKTAANRAKVVAAAPVPVKTTAPSKPPSTQPQAKLFAELAAIRDSGVTSIDEAQLQQLWAQIDANIASKKLYPLRGLQLKKWLASLGDHPKFMQQIEVDYQQISANILSDIAKENAEHDNDPKFKEYKRREQELLQQLKQQYPNDPDLLNEKLEAELDALRVEIYNRQ